MTPRHVKPIFAAIVRVTPNPDSLVYTFPIYKKLKTFGDVTSFKKLQDSVRILPRKLHRPLGEQEFRAVFSTESGLKKALAASPISVGVDHNLPRPEGLDPYNVFGLQDRKRPEPRTFVCHLRTDAGSNSKTTTSGGESTKVTLVKDERTGPLYMGLLEAGVPMSQLEGLATSITVTSPTNQALVSSSPTSAEDPSSITSEIESIQPIPTTPTESPHRPPLKLMEMYRSAMRKQPYQQDLFGHTDTQKHQQSVPIRRQPLTPFHRRRSTP